MLNMFCDCVCISMHPLLFTEVNKIHSLGSAPFATLAALLAAAGAATRTTRRRCALLGLLLQLGVCYGTGRTAALARLQLRNHRAQVQQQRVARRQIRIDRQAVVVAQLDANAAAEQQLLADLTRIQFVLDADVQLGDAQHVLDLLERRMLDAVLLGQTAALLARFLAVQVRRVDANPAARQTT